METITNNNIETLINTSLICAATKRVYEWRDESTFPNEYELNIQFRGCVNWTTLIFASKEELEAVYEQIKKDIA